MVCRRQLVALKLNAAQRALEKYPSIFFQIRLAAALFAHCIHTYGGETANTDFIDSMRAACFGHQAKSGGNLKAE
jgi:hypothetical protein